MYSGVPHVNKDDTPKSWHTVSLIFGRDESLESQQFRGVTPK